MKTYKLKEITNGIFDCPHSTPKWTKTGFPVIRNFNVKDGRLLVHNLSYTDELNYQQRTKRAIPACGDLILTREAPMGEICIIPDNFKCCLGQRVVLIKPCSKIVFPHYLLYKFQSKEVQYQIGMSEGTGSVVSNLRIPLIENLEITLPNYENQKKIASMLGSLDEKIELNSRMNQTLEQMGQTLFKHYFIEPNSNNCRIVKIGDIIKTVLGGTPPTSNSGFWNNGTIPWINSGKVNEFRIIEPTAYITEDALQNSNCKLLPKGTTVIAITGATMGQISRLEISSCANQSVVGLLENKTLPSEFIYFWIKENLDKILSHSTGGAQQHINKNNINQTDILIPPSNILKIFCEYVKPIFNKISNNCFESGTLKSIRDKLLPKLLSGEIDVSKFPAPESIIKQTKIQELV